MTRKIGLLKVDGKARGRESEFFLGPRPGLQFLRRNMLPPFELRQRLEKVPNLSGIRRIQEWILREKRIAQAPGVVGAFGGTQATGVWIGN